MTSNHMGDLLKAIRDRLSLTQERLAGKLNVTFTTVNRWENGHSEPSRLAVKQIEGLIREMGPRGEDLLAKILQYEKRR